SKSDLRSIRPPWKAKRMPGLLPDRATRPARWPERVPPLTVVSSVLPVRPAIGRREARGCAAACEPPNDGNIDGDARQSGQSNGSAVQARRGFRPSAAEPG